MSRSYGGGGRIFNEKQDISYSASLPTEPASIPYPRRPSTAFINDCLAVAGKSPFVEIPVSRDINSK